MDLYEEIRRERDPKSDAAWKARNSWWSTPCAEVKPEAIIPEIRRRWMQQGKIDALLAEGALIEARLMASEKIVAERKAVRRAHRPRAFRIDRLPVKQQAMRNRRQK